MLKTSIKNNIPLLLIVLALPMIGCQKSETISTNNLNQTKFCEVEDWTLDATSKSCVIGQKVVFLPKVFGNAQLPVMFSAANCDLRYEVVLTEGAVTCIYNPVSVPDSKKQ